MKKNYTWCLLLLTFGLTQALASYPEYQQHSNHGLKGEGSYLTFTDRIDKSKIKTIFEIGSRDAKDAIELSDLFHQHVFAFECNPTAIELCKANIGDNPNITLVPLGVWDTSGELSFFRVLDGNIGASSFFEFNPQARNYPDIVEEGLVQEEIKVSTVRLDEYLNENNIENIDLLCMDVQGAAFEVLSSLGTQLAKVKYIIVELETHPIYSGEMLYEEVDRFLIQSGFERVSEALESGSLFGDVLYRNLTST